MPHALIVRFTTKDEEAAEAFDRLVSDVLVKVREQEPGTLVYVSHVPQGEPLTRIFYELYANESAFEAHERQPHVERFLQAREQYLRSTEVTVLSEIDGKRPEIQESP